MRRALTLGLALAVPVVLFAADLFPTLGWEQAKFEDTCFAFAVVYKSVCKSGLRA
jgi:hypothetical protein